MELNSLRFTKTHEWVSSEGRVGISDHAQKEITDVVFVELPSVGVELAQGKEAGTIESVKAAFPIYAPLSGNVIHVNQEVSQNPAIVNESPYEKGWMYQISILNPDEFQGLLTHDQYQEFLHSEVSHH